MDFDESSDPVLARMDRLHIDLREIIAHQATKADLREAHDVIVLWIVLVFALTGLLNWLCHR